MLDVGRFANMGETAIVPIPVPILKNLANNSWIFGILIPNLSSDDPKPCLKNSETFEIRNLQLSTILQFFLPNFHICFLPAALRAVYLSACGVSLFSQRGCRDRYSTG